MQRVAELPFTASRARMTTVHQRGEEIVAYTKGAPEQVLLACRDRLGADGVVALDHARVISEVEEMAQSGLRVLAVAMRSLPEMPCDTDTFEKEQTFLGLVGCADPPRAEAAEAIALCQSAGIHVVMITGDHAATARTIAAKLGIAPADGQVLTGTALRKLTDAELDGGIRVVRVYARVAPEDKIRIVATLQRAGEYVAMTGDGVNDAPALRLANIGVAMGRGGTDVAREAAHMILLDDNFSSIVNAVHEGRRVYDNIRRFVRYSLSTNAGEIATLFLAPFVGLPLPLLPIQILWMNLVTDGLPGIALAAEPAERDAMRRPPRPPNESIFAHGLWQHAAWVGLLMAALALGTQAWSLRVADAHWQTMTFTVLTFSQLAHALAIRSERLSLFQLGLMTNRPLLAAIAVTVLMQLAALYVPALNRVFTTEPLSILELLACIALSSVVFAAVELEKFLIRRGILHD
jgi:Ca2+-transporting ATPase